MLELQQCNGLTHRLEASINIINDKNKKYSVSGEKRQLIVVGGDGSVDVNRQKACSCFWSFKISSGE